MQNKAAEKFVKQLRAAMGHKMSEDTATLYVSKLSKWKLPSEVWEKVIDTLIEEIEPSQSGYVEIPPLSRIYELLKANNSTALNEQTGFFCFDYNGSCHACKVWLDGTTWRWIRWRQDGRGWTAEKTTEAFVPPAEAENIHFTTGRDDETYSEDTRTWAEARASVDGKGKAQ